ncbi:hypothetical protein Vi05172_g6514 [Venturia inaequalis]|nr:hypothetical protein Vi05172_g6514 [Venturia inaequalis]
MSDSEDLSLDLDTLFRASQYTSALHYLNSLNDPPIPLAELPTTPLALRPSEQEAGYNLGDELSFLGFHRSTEGGHPGFRQESVSTTLSSALSGPSSLTLQPDSPPQSSSASSDPQDEHPSDTTSSTSIMPSNQISYPKFSGTDNENIDVFLMMLEFAFKKNVPDTSGGDPSKKLERDKELCCQIFCQCHGDASEFLSSLDTTVMMNYTLLTDALKKQFPVTLSDGSRKQEARQAMRSLHQGSLTLDDYVEKAKQIKKYLHETLRPDLAEYFVNGLLSDRVKENAIGHLHHGDTAFEDIVFKVRTITRSLAPTQNASALDKTGPSMSSKEIADDSKDKWIQQLTGIIGNLSIQSRAQQGQNTAYPPQFRSQTQYPPHAQNPPQFPQAQQQSGQQQQQQNQQQPAYVPQQNGTVASGANATPLGNRGDSYPPPTGAWVMGANGKPKWPCDRCGTMSGCYPSNCPNTALPQQTQDMFKNVRLQAQREWNAANPNNQVGRRNNNLGNNQGLNHRQPIAANVIDFDPNINGQPQLLDYPMHGNEYNCNAIEFNSGTGIRIIAEDDDIEVAAVAPKRHRGPGGKFTKETDEAFFATQPPLAPEVQKAANKVIAEGMIVVRPGESTIKGTKGLRDFDALSALRTYKVQMSFMTLADLSPTVRDQVIEAFQTEIPSTKDVSLEPGNGHQPLQTVASDSTADNRPRGREGAPTPTTTLRPWNQPPPSRHATVEEVVDSEQRPTSSEAASDPALRTTANSTGSPSTGEKRNIDNANAVVPFQQAAQTADVYIATKAHSHQASTDVVRMIAEADRAIPWFSIAACAIDSKDSFGRNFYTRALLPNEGITWEVPRTLIDGGSLLSFISMIAVEKMDLPVIQTSGFEVNVANGSAAAISGRVQLPVIVSGVSILQDLYIMPGTPPYAILLGRQWLKAAQAIGIYSLNEYWIRDGHSMMRKLEETHARQIPRSYRPPKIGISGQVRQLRDLDVDESCLFEIAADIVHQSQLASAPLGKGNQL